MKISTLVDGIKNALNAKDDDYITVFIRILVGTRKDVIESETTINSVVDIDNLACKSAIIKLSDWKGERTEE